MSLRSPHNSNIFSVNTHRQEADFSRARTVSRHFSSRARIGLRSGVGVGIDAVATTVKRSFNGKSRRTSEVCHAAGAATRQLAPGMKTNARLTLERFARFEREACLQLFPACATAEWRHGSMANLAPPARLAVEGALYRGRYGINTGSHAAPQPDPRARREVSAHRARSRKICFLPVGVDRENF